MIDKITWDDLNLDEIILELNTCTTSAGEEYLYKSIDEPFNDNRNDFIYLINNNCIDAKRALEKIGKLKSYKFYECLDKINIIEAEKNIKHYITILVVLISFALIFVYPGPGVLAMFATVSFALVTYFKEQRLKAGELYAFSYIIKLLNGVSHINSDKSETGKKLIDELHKLKKELSNIGRFSFLIKKNVSTDGNPVDIILDYFRMIFHLDIIKFNNMVFTVKENSEKISRLFEIIGLIDASYAVKRYRDSFEYYCTPQFIDNNHIEIEDGYHPLIKSPVVNSINTENCVLLTGSNASGKSTFLKMIALNIVFSESFGFAFAKSIKLKRCSIYTSMALKDSISEGESYFIKEIKALKRIIDKVSDNEFIICFIDEILRGTNTIERIAASSEILLKLSEKNVLVFAATHDMELTSTLASKYDNYHFTENIKDNDISFSYKLIEGAAKTRNAVKLLSFMGFDNDTVENAYKRIENFEKSGTW